MSLKRELGATDAEDVDVKKTKTNGELKFSVSSCAVFDQRDSRSNDL